MLQLHQRNAELEAWRLEREQLDWAQAWIRAHGGSVSAALKATHPDHGGAAADFMLTQKARAILEREL